MAMETSRRRHRRKKCGGRLRARLGSERVVSSSTRDPAENASGAIAYNRVALFSALTRAKKLAQKRAQVSLSIFTKVPARSYTNLRGKQLRRQKKTHRLQENMP